jgi:hypothetical protein
MTQNPRITIRKADGSVWCSSSGENTHTQALQACLAPQELTDQARMLIRRLCKESITGVAIEQDGDFYKIRCVRSGCRVTIPLRNPKRRVTWMGFKRLAAGLWSDAPGTSSATPASPIFEIPMTQALPRDNYVRARAALIERDLNPSDHRLVEAVAAHLSARGALPPEILSIRTCVAAGSTRE